MKVSSRPSIHRGDSQSSEVEGYKKEELDDRPNSAQSFCNTESDSDYEDYDVRQQSQSSEISVQENEIPITSHSPKRQQYRPKQSAHYYAPESNALETKTSSSVTLRGLLALIATSIAIYYCYAATSTSTSVNGCSFQKLQKLFPEQDLKVWKHLNVGIENILEQRVQTPAVYLFVHEGGQRVKQLVREIASYSSSCFDQSMRHAEMDVNDFNSDETLIDYGYAIKRFKEKIQSGNVILIANLNEIPANAARALHSICDTISPIAPDIVIFLTLTVNDIDRGNIESITEDALKQLWGPHLEYNELDPLITRVTDQVIALRS